MTGTEDLEEYWAVVRPVRLPSQDPITKDLALALSTIEFWVSLIDDQGREQTPRIQVVELTGIINFPQLTGPIHMARMVLWRSKTAEGKSQQLGIAQLGVNLLAGYTPSVSYSFNF